MLGINFKPSNNLFQRLFQANDLISLIKSKKFFKTRGLK